MRPRTRRILKWTGLVGSLALTLVYLASFLLEFRWTSSDQQRTWLIKDGQLVQVVMTWVGRSPPPSHPYSRAYPAGFAVTRNANSVYQVIPGNGKSGVGSTRIPLLLPLLVLGIGTTVCWLDDRYTGRKRRPVPEREGSRCTDRQNTWTRRGMHIGAIAGLVFFGGCALTLTGAGGRRDISIGSVIFAGSCVVGPGMIFGATAGFWLATLTAPRPGHCRCGYNLAGNESGRCPECGTPIKDGTP